MNWEQELLAVRTPEQLFGKEASLEEVNKKFREMSRVLHPDAGGSGDLYIRLNEIHQAALQAFKDGTYGLDHSQLVKPIAVVTKRNRYMIRGLEVGGDIANIYRGDYKPDETTYVEIIMKVARNARNNDLMANEAKAIKKVLSNSETYDLVEPYMPRYIESFGWKPGKKKPRQATIFERRDGLVSLARVHEVYETLNPRHVAWMLRRMLYALGFAHANGVIHGGLNPYSVLIHPEHHGMVLTNWEYASIDGATIKAIPSKWKAFYPPEVIGKHPPSVGTDIYMAVECMWYLLGGEHDLTPKPLKAFLRGCQQTNHLRRPQSAWDLLDEFNELIERMWGPRKYIPFSVPDNKETL